MEQILHTHIHTHTHTSAAPPSPQVLNTWTVLPDSFLTLRVSDGANAPQLKVDVLNTSAVLLHWEWELLGIPSVRKDNYHIQAIELRRLDLKQNPVSLTVNPPQSKYILTGLGQWTLWLCDVDNLCDDLNGGRVVLYSSGVTGRN